MQCFAIKVFGEYEMEETSVLRNLGIIFSTLSAFAGVILISYAPLSFMLRTKKCFISIWNIVDDYNAREKKSLINGMALLLLAIIVAILL